MRMQDLQFYTISGIFRVHFGYDSHVYCSILFTALTGNETRHFPYGLTKRRFFIIIGMRRDCDEMQPSGQDCLTCYA